MILGHNSVTTWRYSMSFTQISPFEAKELIGDFPHDQMITHICSEPVNIRLGAEKLEVEACKIVGRAIQHGESFFFINKAMNHIKIILKGEHGVDMMERKKASGKYKLPPVASMGMRDLMNYIDGEAVLH